MLLLLFVRLLPIRVKSVCADQGFLFKKKYTNPFWKNLSPKYVIFDIHIILIIKLQTKQLKVGLPTSPDSDLGALISDAHLAKIEYYVNLARENGKIEAGGERVKVEGAPNGYYYAPTVITNVDCTHRAAQEEIFGPVVTVSFRDT